MVCQSSSESRGQVAEEVKEEEFQDCEGRTKAEVNMITEACASPPVGYGMPQPVYKVGMGKCDGKCKPSGRWEI